MGRAEEDQEADRAKKDDLLISNTQRFTCKQSILIYKVHFSV